MVIVCRRCGHGVNRDDVDALYEWRDNHACVPLTPPAPVRQRLRARVTEDYSHGDWRRYRSRTQRCTCARCHRAWLDHLYETVK